jgi:23S rRNA U2552 (ribose-2'-O)-methylase RlmE/FtsJ
MMTRVPWTSSHSRRLTRAFSIQSYVYGAKSGSSHRWLRRQREDMYTRQAAISGYRARSAFKLCALDDKYRFLKPGVTCVDCGASPGGWSQVAAERIFGKHLETSVETDGVVVAVDLIPMQPLPHVHFVQGDFTEPDTQRRILDYLPLRQADVVLSDMAPAFSGKYLFCVCVHYNHHPPLTVTMHNLIRNTLRRSSTWYGIV